MTERSAFWDDLRSAAANSNDVSYADVVSEVPERVYRTRIARIGFEDQASVLDLGCGFGQWSWALSARNANVVAMEIHENRLKITRDFLTSKGRSNVTYTRADGNKLPFADASFDSVFCYGVFMFLSLEQARDEIHRVLVPGGRAYFCTNGPGWWASLVAKHLRGSRPVYDAARKAFSNGIGGGVPSSIAQADVPTVFPAPDWKVIETAAEGRLAGGGPELAVYEPKHFNLDNVIDLIVEKTPKATPEERVDRQVQMIQGLVENTAAKTRYNYRAGVLDHIQPYPVTDLTYAAETERIERVRKQLIGVDRWSVLRWMYDRITEGAPTDLQRLQRLVTFAQLHFFHHFGGQTVRANGSLVFDPLETFVLRNARCGAVARWIIDVMETGGFRGRLIGAACHTSCEIMIDGDWVLADASLFPPGTMPTAADGRPLSFDQATSAPERLDIIPNYINYERDAFAEVYAHYPELQDSLGYYCDSPILPSTGYFGDKWAADGQVSVYRYEKTAPSKELDQAEYGWHQYSTLQENVKAVRTLQRPGQVSDIRIEDGVLQWTPGVDHGGSGAVAYKILASPHSRGWSYGSIPIDSDFAVPGSAIVTHEPRIAVSDLPQDSRYITVIAVAADLPEDTFYLPSAEFDLVSADAQSQRKLT